MSDRKSILPSLFLAFLLVGSVLLVMPTEAFPTTPKQRAAAVTALGDDAPTGAFQVRATENRFWLRSDPTADAGFYTNAATLSGAAFDSNAPTDVDCVPEHVANTVQASALCSGTVRVAKIDKAGNTARFPMPESLAAEDTYHLLRITGKVLAGCDAGPLSYSVPGTQQPLASLGGITLTVIAQKQSGGAWVDARTLGSTRLVPDGYIWSKDLDVDQPSQFPYSVQMFRGTSTQGDFAQLTGPAVEPGERLLAQYSVGTADVQCFLYYGVQLTCNVCLNILTGGRTEYSEVTLSTDAARVALYTTDPEGNPVTGFPSADSIDSSERRIVVEALYASAFGPGIMPQLIEQRHANVRLQDLDKAQYLYYVDNVDGVNCISSAFPCGGFPQEFNTQHIRLISSRADNLYPEPDVEQDLGSSVLRRSYVFAYNATQPDVKRLQPEFYSNTDKWSLNGPLAAIGGKGITFELIPGESLTHLVNPKETTQFSFIVKNIGSQTDVVTVTAAEPGGGWTATVLGGGKYLLPAGSRAIGQVEITPPPSAVAGSRSVVLRASSSFADVPDPATFTLTTTLTDTVTHGVQIASDLDTFAVKQGATKGFPITVGNLGSGRESFVVIPSVPSNVQGYTITVNPASLQLVAGGRQQLTVTIKAPAETPTITSWTLGLTAVAVGDSTVADRIDPIVSLVPVEGLLADILEPGVARKLRQQAEECNESALQDFNNENGFDFPSCQAATATPIGNQGIGHIEVDEDFDDSAIFRITLHNVGDVAESYRAEGFWDLSADGVDDVAFCDGAGNSPDGIPDGWRFNWDTGVGSGVPAGRQMDGLGRYNGGFSGRYQLSPSTAPLVVPAHSSKDVYLEIGHVFLGCEGGLLVGLPPEYWVAPDVPVSPTYSSTAKMVVTMTSLNDPAKLISFPAQAVVDAPGVLRGNQVYSGGTHLPAVEAVNTTVARTLLSGSATMDIRAINKGNEHDDLTVSVAGDPRWSHRLVVIDSAPKGKLCDLPAGDSSGQTMLCPDMGVYDEMRIQVVATPGPLVRVGDVDTITVKVASGDAPGIERSLSLAAQATGTFVFNTAPLGSVSRSVAPGASVSFPFVIQNSGTSGDSYRMSLLSGSNDWKPVLSSSAPVFVPSGFTIPAHLTVTAPIGSPVGTTDVFRIQVESVGNLAKRTFEVTPTVQAAGGLLVNVKDGQDVLIPTRGVETPITVQAVPAAGSASGSAIFTVDRQSLPPGWTVDQASITAPFSTAVNNPTVSEATFKVTAPANALGTAHGILHIDAVTTGSTVLRGATDVNLNLASTFGLQLNVTNGDKQVIAPGGPAVFNLTLKNLGLGADTVRMANSVLPSGWTLFFTPPAVTLGPLEAVDVQVTLRAPTTAQPADIASVIIFAASVNDAGTLVSLPLSAQVGYNAIVAKATGPIPKGAPQETLVQVINVTNNGTLPDQIRLGAVLDTLGLADHVKVTLEPALVSLKPNETIQVTLSQVLGHRIPGNISLQTTVVARSLLDERPEALRARASLPVAGRVLPYAALDINGDGAIEYAVDRNDAAADGFEQFRASLTPGARPLGAPDLAAFLRDEARESFSSDVTLENGTVVRVVDLKIDGDKDGKRDLFVDKDGDNQPDYYWDPDANKASPIEFRKDINGDQVPESFVDTSGDGKLDAVYDLTRGVFTPVIQIDVDGDGELDYVVDKNGNSLVDQDETVLYTRDGALLIVQKIDVDGDGRLDQVFDVDGDGTPDYFIPAGTTEGVDIALRDVNGDGTQDWTFDGDGDGRRESYYDPVTGKAHVIDAAGHFGDALKEYWYIGALFAIVLGLFVALVLVTRR